MDSTFSHSGLDLRLASALTGLTLSPAGYGDRELDRGAFTETERGMAVEEKPGVKSSSSIVPCFLFVEVRHMNELSYYFSSDTESLNNTFKHKNQHLRDLFPRHFISQKQGC